MAYNEPHLFISDLKEIEKIESEDLLHVRSLLGIDYKLKFKNLIKSFFNKVEENDIEKITGNNKAKLITGEYKPITVNQVVKNGAYYRTILNNFITNFLFSFSVDDFTQASRDPTANVYNYLTIDDTGLGIFEIQKETAITEVYTGDNIQELNRLVELDLPISIKTGNYLVVLLSGGKDKTEVSGAGGILITKIVYLKYTDKITTLNIDIGSSGRLEIKRKRKNSNIKIIDWDTGHKIWKNNIKLLDPLKPTNSLLSKYDEKNKKQSVNLSFLLGKTRLGDTKTEVNWNDIYSRIRESGNYDSKKGLVAFKFLGN